MRKEAIIILQSILILSLILPHVQAANYVNDYVDSVNVSQGEINGFNGLRDDDTGSNYDCTFSETTITGDELTTTYIVNFPDSLLPMTEYEVNGNTDWYYYSSDAHIGSSTYPGSRSGGLLSPEYDTSLSNRVTLNWNVYVPFQTLDSGDVIIKVLDKFGSWQTIENNVNDDGIWETTDSRYFHDAFRYAIEGDVCTTWTWSEILGVWVIVIEMIEINSLVLTSYWNYVDLDLVFTFSNVFTRASTYYLDIEAGRLDTENLRVWILSGSSWVSLGTISTWAVYSYNIKPYISSTVKVRIQGSFNVNDEINDSWKADFLRIRYLNTIPLI